MAFVIGFFTVLAVILMVAGASMSLGGVFAVGCALLVGTFFLEEFSRGRRENFLVIAKDLFTILPIFWRAVVTYLLLLAGLMSGFGLFIIPGPLPTWWWCTALLLLGSAALVTALAPLLKNGSPAGE